MLFRIFCWVFVTFFSVTLFGQNGAPKKIYLFYKITPEETLELLAKQNFNPTPDYFHTLIKLPAKDLTSNPELPPGNYLRVTNVDEDIDIELLIKTSATVDLIDANKYLYFNPVYATLEKKASAKIWLDGKLLKWHEPTQHFRWKKKKRKKKVKMVARINDQIVHRTLDKEYQYRNNFWIKLNPIKWPRRLFYGIENTIQKIKNPNFGGYMVLNKPEYRPSDTLKMKAYFVDKKGRFPKEPLYLRSFGYGSRSSGTKLFPDKNGNYTYELVLHDSLELKLDRNYYVSFKNKYLSSFGQSFRFKDYQLDEIAYDFELKNRTYYYGDTIRFLANGFYKNGLRVKDAKVKIQILAPKKLHKLVQPRSFYADKVIIRDTLWTYEQALDKNQPTNITVPDSIIPPATFQYRVIATFSNANGEIQTQRLSLYPRKNPAEKMLDCFAVSLDTKTLTVQNNCPNRPGLDQIILEKRTDYIHLERKKINLPYQEEVGSRNYTWQFFTEDSILIQTFDLSKENAQVAVSGEHVGDSLYVYVRNPRSLPLVWEWYENKKLKTAASSIPAGVFFSRVANPNKSYYLKYSYKWNGRIFNQNLDLKFYKNKLDMQVIQPAVIQPGATVAVKVKIKDEKGKNAANVNLTALSINDQFKNSNLYGPKIKIGPFKKPKKKPSYRFNTRKNIKRKKITKNWVERMKLTEDLFYKIRYPQKGVLLHYEKIKGDSFYQDIAQFAPYIIKDGKEQPILMIKVNRELVYFYDVDDNPPYSFVGNIGNNRITIRTNKYEYTLPKIELKAGYKLEISIKESNYLNSNISIKRIPKEGSWTNSEKNLINKSILVLKNHWNNWFDETAFTQGNNRIHFINNKKKYFKLGPFRNQNIQFYPSLNRVPLNTTYQPINLKFESGFSYQLTPERDRLYEYDFKLNKPLPKKLPVKYPLNKIYAPDDLKRIYALDIAGGTQSPRNKLGKNTAIFKINNEKKIRLTLLKSKDSLQVFIPGFNPKFQALSDGNFELSVLYKDGSYLEHDFNIEGNVVLFEDLSKKVLMPDSSQVFLKKLMQKHPDLFTISLADLPQKLMEEKRQPLKPYQVPFSGIWGVIREAETNEPLIGATVLIQKSNLGTVTNLEGEFNLELPYGVYEVTVSYTGFSSQTLTVSVPSSNSFNIKMMAGPSLLDEVVVVGYGREKKRRRAEVALAGRAAGVFIKDDVTVRGSRSDAVDYYIDGTRVRGGQIGEEEIKQSADYQLEGTESEQATNNSLRSEFSDYAYFQPRLVTDQNGEAFFNVTYPDNTTRWNNFVIGMNRKKQAGMVQSTTDAYKKVMAQLAIPRFLVAGDQINLVGKSLNYSGDTISTKTKFISNGKILQSNQFSLSDVKIEKSLLNTPTTDSITLTYELSSVNYQDGEQRSIPVLPIGVEEISGIYNLLTKDTTISVEFDPNNGPVFIRAETNQISIARSGLKYLRRYRHECNEQAASKLLALVWDKKLAKVLKKSHDHEKQIKRLVRLLEKRQNSLGYWSWWSTGEPNYWMSFHIVKVLSFANENGYPSSSLDKALIWMANEAENFSPSLRLRWLDLLIDIQQNADFENWLEPLEKNWQGKSLYDTLLIAKIKQAADLPINLESLKTKMHKTFLGNYYFGEIKRSYQIRRTHFNNNLLAYHIFSNAGEITIADGLKRYILRRKNRNNYWYNTYLTAKIIHSLLKEDFDKNGLLNRSASLTVNDTLLRNFSDTVFQLNHFSNHLIRFEKSGNAPLYLTAYQEFWNPTPKPKSDIFEITTELLQDNQKVTVLEANEKVQLKVSVKSEALAEYMVIEIPIPASCSYDDTYTRNWRNRFQYETHREYFKDRIAIYCRRLPAGNHTFIVNLEPGYTGTFTMNPATAEMMYFPTFNGRNESRKVEVVE